MKYLRIKNYGKLNHYKGSDQSQIWLKLYKNMVISLDWVRLKDSEKSWIIALLCIANKHGCVENDASLIQLCANLRRKPDIQKLVDICFIEYTDSNDGTSSRVGLGSELPERAKEEKEKKKDPSRYEGKQILTFEQMKKRAQEQAKKEIEKLDASLATALPTGALET